MKNTINLLLILLVFSQRISAQNTLDNAGLGPATPAEAAYSLRLLSSGYTGAAIQVRRSSDDVTQDIGFTSGGYLDTTALLSFTDNSNAYVSIWYDQSGNARDMIKTDFNQQPQIVFSGTFKYIGSRVAIDFNDNKGLVYEGALQLYSICTVIKSESTVWPNYHSILDATPRIGGILSNNGTNFWQDAPQIEIWKNGVKKTNNESLSPVDEGMILSFSSQTSIVSRIFIGNFDAGSNGGSILENEAVAFGSLLSNTDRKIIECNQGVYYSIVTDCNTVINVQPSNTDYATCVNNSTIPLTINASGLDLTYQWYSNTVASNSGGSLINGATNSSFTPPTITEGTTYYYVEVTGSVGSMVVSDVSGAITVDSSPTINISPLNPTIINGDSILLTATGASSFLWGKDYSNPISKVADAKMAVGLRKLNNSYTGPAIRLIRETDNAQADFGFINNDLDTIAIKTFLGEANGYCAILYDQSGNGNNMEQPNTGQQPLLVTAGLNGKPILQLTPGTSLYNNTDNSTPFTVLYTVRQTGPSRGRVLAGLNNNWLLGYWGGNMNAAYFEGWVSQSGGITADSNPYVYSATGDGTISAFYQNGVLIDSNGNGTSGPNGLTLNGNESSNAEVAELFVFDRKLNEDDRSYMENSSGNYYDIIEGLSQPGATYMAAPTVTTQFNVIGYSANQGCVVYDSSLVRVHNPPNLGNFTSMVRTTYETSFTLNKPSSKGSGAFTFTSSNPSVATIQDTIVQIKGAGVTTILATQAEDDTYYSDTISAILNVNTVIVNTKSGEITSTKTDYVNKNGELSGNTGLNKNGAIVITKYISDGLSSQTAANSAMEIKQNFPDAPDGQYWIRFPNGSVKQIYCIMNNAVNGGGWMLMMKTTAGNTFNYDSPYWTTDNTLNESDVTRNDGDAKYETMNSFLAKDMLALWPDIPSDYNNSSTGGSINLAASYNNWSWLQNNFNNGEKITPLQFFSTANNNFLGDAELYEGKGTAFSGQGDVRFYGFNYTGNNNARVRWGFGWNENGGGLYPDGDQGSNDVSGGIGMSSSYGEYSAGDRINCCENSVGINRSARVEIYVR